MGMQGLFEQDSAGNHNDGLLLVGCDVSLDVLNEAKERDIPVVLVDNESKEGKVDSVVSDNEAAAKCAMEHFHALGRRKIAFIGGPQNHVSLAQRYKGYVSALEDFGMDVRKEWVIFAESVELHGPEIGYEGTSRLMEMPERPTAIFADNDMTALGVLKAFTILIGVTGIGPQTAMNILSRISFEDFAIAILSDDEKVLYPDPGDRAEERQTPDPGAERQDEEMCGDAARRQEPGRGLRRGERPGIARLL